MKQGKNIRGVTLIEMLVVAAIIGIVASSFVVLLAKNISFFQRIRVRQQVMLESRTAMETIQKALRNGQARSVVISSPGTLPVPNSRIDFQLQDPLPSGTTAYAIFMCRDDGCGQGLRNRTVYTQEYHPTLTFAPRPLASNVTGLMFTGDAKDPAIVAVTLRIDATWDTSNKPDRRVTLILPNHTVKMVETP